ncbi:hypothetical protein BOTNAR_0258g00020 [Botryotinia narcissicola]|uniref:Uncharacterized protein n=1 Tax=Botryotinia narcissicola TaxID=278944 RepID=A0A4Z1HZT5_9HELO|nr:hypothetical protein BOTNAR_0258g00020 [Botryotinia narcissicola]
MGNIVTNLQAGSKAAVEEKAGDAILESPSQCTPTLGKVALIKDIVFDSEVAVHNTARINLQNIEDGNEFQVQTARPTKMPKKTFGFTRSVRKARSRWKVEERKQIALGVHHKDEIPKVVDAARKEAKRQYREEMKARRASKRESETIKSQRRCRKLELRVLLAMSMVASGLGNYCFNPTTETMQFTDVFQIDAAQLPPQAANIESNERMDADKDMGSK